MLLSAPALLTSQSQQLTAAQLAAASAAAAGQRIAQQTNAANGHPPGVVLAQAVSPTASLPPGVMMSNGPSPPRARSPGSASSVDGKPSGGKARAKPDAAARSSPVKQPATPAAAAPPALAPPPGPTLVVTNDGTIILAPSPPPQQGHVTLQSLPPPVTLPTVAHAAAAGHSQQPSPGTPAAAPALVAGRKTPPPLPASVAGGRKTPPPNTMPPTLLPPAGAMPQGMGVPMGVPVPGVPGAPHGTPTVQSMVDAQGNVRQVLMMMSGSQRLALLPVVRHDKLLPGGPGPGPGPGLGPGPGPPGGAVPMAISPGGGVGGVGGVGVSLPIALPMVGAATSPLPLAPGSPRAGQWLPSAQVEVLCAIEQQARCGWAEAIVVRSEPDGRVRHRGQSRRPGGGAMPGPHGLLRVSPKAWGRPPHSRGEAEHLRSPREAVPSVGASAAPKWPESQAALVSSPIPPRVFGHPGARAPHGGAGGRPVRTARARARPAALRDALRVRRRGTAKVWPSWRGHGGPPGTGS